MVFDAGRAWPVLQACGGRPPVTRGHGLEPGGQGARSGRRPCAITDSTAILTFLADRHGLLTHPAGDLDRARQDSLTPVLPDDCDAAPRVAARYSFILPRALRRPGIKTSLHRGFARSQTTLVQRMGGGAFLMGDVMTVPDIILGHCWAWAEAAKLPITRPHLARACGADAGAPGLSAGDGAVGGGCFPVHVSEAPV